MKKFVFFLLLLSLIFAKSAYFHSYDGEIWIREDGSFFVEERLNLFFEGEFQEGWRDIPLENGMQISNIKVYVDGRQVETTTSISQNVFTIEWDFYAKDAIKEFTILYTVKNQLKKHQDVAEFFWQFIGEQWDLEIPTSTFIVNLPAGTLTSEVLAWGHSHASGNTEIKKEKVIFTAEDIPAGELVEARIVFNADLIKGPYAVETNEQALDRIIQEEETAAAWNFLVVLLPFIFLFLVPIILIFGLYDEILSYISPYITEPKIKYFRDIPVDYPPAILGALLGNLGTKDVMATIVGLAEKKYLLIREIEKKGIIEDLTPWIEKEVEFELLKEDNSKLFDFEKKTLKWMFGKPRKGKKIKMSSLSKKKNTSFYKSFLHQVKKNAKEMKLIEKKESEKGIAYHTALFLTVALGIASTFLSEICPCVCISYIFLIIILIGIKSSRDFPTENGKQDLEKWHALKRYLSDFTQMKNNPPSAVILWDRFIVYAITLGIADRVFKYMEMNLKDYKPRYLRTSTASYTALAMMNTSFSRSLASTMTTSRTGHGGSFSSGGASFGGGGGGGGGGFR
ncbi:DUF2207 domain-containing protein [Candidatus Micrarchaeota archaeon]|nr:DUF2207 domain-containing protein [Candidatus Micrarchaeota archaeon]